MAVTDSIDNSDSAGEAVNSQAFELTTPDNSQVQSWAMIIENGFDVSVDITLQFTTDDDETFSKYITDGNIAEGVTISSGTRDGFGDQANTPWSYVRAEVTPASDPTSGTVDLTFQSRRVGGD